MDEDPSEALRRATEQLQAYLDRQEAAKTLQRELEQPRRHLRLIRGGREKLSAETKEEHD